MGCDITPEQHHHDNHRHSLQPILWPFSMKQHTRTHMHTEKHTHAHTYTHTRTHTENTHTHTHRIHCLDEIDFGWRQMYLVLNLVENMKHKNVVLWQTQWELECFYYHHIKQHLPNRAVGWWRTLWLKSVHKPLSTTFKDVLFKPEELSLKMCLLTNPSRLSTNPS